MLEKNWIDDVLDEFVTPCHPVKSRGVTAVTCMDKGSSNFVTSVTPVTPGNDRFEKKSADILEVKRESRRLKVLAMLKNQPNIQRAFLTDTEADPDNVILTIAIRDQYTFEMQISKDKYDAFTLLEMINKGEVQ